MNIVIRAATSEDFEVVCALYDQLARVHAQALPHFFRPAEGPALTHEWFAAVLANEQAVIFVAEEQHTIIGMLHGYIHTTPAVPVVVPRRFMHIEDLIVSERARQQGVGQLLTERAHQWASEHGIREMELDVWEFPTSAQAFYEKLGYQTTRRHMRKHLP